MNGGLTWLRWAVATQWWHFVRRVVDTPSRLVGLPEPGDVPSVPEVEAALGEDDGLTVFVGDRSEDAARSVHLALRLMLGDLELVRLVDPHSIDLAGFLTFARRRPRGRQLVLFADEAPPSLLDQLSVETRELLDAQVRLVVLTRPTFLDTLAPEQFAAVFEDAAGAVLPRSSGPDPTPPTQALERAVVDTVVDWDRLGVGRALTSALLAQLVVAHLPAGRDVPGVSSMSRALRRCRRDGHVFRTRRGGEDHLAPARTWVVAVDGDGPLGRPVPEAFGLALRKWLAAEDRLLAGRVALARDDQGVALWLLASLDAGTVPPRIAAIVGGHLAARALAHEDDRLRAANDPDSPGPLRRGAMGWLRSAADRGEAEIAAYATRGAGVVAYRLSDWSTAGELLADAGRDETDREAQFILGRMAVLMPGDDASRRADGRRRLELVLAGGDSDDLAAQAATLLTDVATEDRRDDDAVPLLAIVARASDPAAAHTARLRRVRLLRRLGRHDEERRAVTEMLGLLEDSDPVERRQEVQLEAAEVRRHDGDLDGAAQVLRETAVGGRVLGLRAAVELGELELGRERWQDVLEALPETLPVVYLAKLPEDLLARREIVRGEAAFHLEQFEIATRAFNQLPKDAHAVLRLGEIALARGRALDAYRYFVKAQELGVDDSGLVQRAAELARSVRVQADREYAQEQAVAARQAEFAFDPDIAPA